jgi:phytanoyl-CoA hydroxylase
MPSDSRPSPPSLEGLTPEQLQQFHRDGYLTLPDYLDQSTCTSLLSTINTLLREFPLDTHPMTRFSTGETSDHVGDDYFLTSGDKVRFFFEEAAFSDPGNSSSSGSGGSGSILTKPKERAINKIGHALHTHIPAFAAISHAGPIGKLNATIASQLGFRDPRLLQSMVICKQPEIGGAVPAHQDSTFLYTDRPSAVGYWIALEDATEENGCLSFARGSHRTEPIRRRFVRVSKGRGCELEGGGAAAATVIEDITTAFETLDTAPEEARWPRDFQHNDSPYSSSTTTTDQLHQHDHDHKYKYELAPVRAGTLVLIHGNLMHKSEKNTSQRGRMIYTFHVIDGREKYDGRNWLQIPGGPAALTRLDGN